MVRYNMSASEVHVVLDALEAAGCAVWLEGGWGVDALAGGQTRPHRDLDIDIDADQEAVAISALQRLGYEIETDWRPHRVELAAPGRGRVDVHPLTFDMHGNGIQTGLDRERYVYPAAAFVTGTIDDRLVGCLSAEQQIAWHTGYELRDTDHADLAVLRQLGQARTHPGERSSIQRLSLPQDEPLSHVEVMADPRSD
jgi:lincosamide nucleotidyltransferase A/C/D/E